MSPYLLELTKTKQGFWIFCSNFLSALYPNLAHSSCGWSLVLHLPHKIEKKTRKNTNTLCPRAHDSTLPQGCLQLIDWSIMKRVYSTCWGIYKQRRPELITRFSQTTNPTRKTKYLEARLLLGDDVLGLAAISNSESECHMHFHVPAAS
jgi:hypothetical protein